MSAMEKVEGIEKDREETCLYTRLFLNYTYGLDRVHTGEEIEKAKASSSFEFIALEIVLVKHISY
jgi:hypothetical protein